MNCRKMTLFFVLIISCALSLPGAESAESIVGKWTYHQGAFTDVHVYHADGTVTAPNHPEASARWRMEGSEVVSLWHNKWGNRLKLPIVNDTLSGVSISPTGVRAAITLTRIGKGPVNPPPPPPPPPTSPVDLNGSWSNGLLHIWQEGDQVLVTASWKRGNSVWVVFRAEGRLSGRTMILPIRYSTMTNAVAGDLKGNFTISEDGNTISVRYTLDGRPHDNRTYSRDR